MWYTEGEVLKAYRNAADKSEIVDILCQINSCSRQQIMSILIKNNIIDIDGNEIKQAIINKNEVSDMARINWDKEKLDKIQSMLNEGKTQKQIGEHFGVTAGNISAICVKHNIKKNKSTINSNSAIVCEQSELIESTPSDILDNSGDNLEDKKKENIKEMLNLVLKEASKAFEISENATDILCNYTSVNELFTVACKLTQLNILSDTIIKMIKKLVEQYGE